MERGYAANLCAEVVDMAIQDYSKGYETMYSIFGDVVTEQDVYEAYQNKDVDGIHVKTSEFRRINTYFECERFFFSEWFTELCDVDPWQIIEQVEAKVQEKLYKKWLKRHKNYRH